MISRGMRFWSCSKNCGGGSGSGSGGMIKADMVGSMKRN